MDEEAVLEPSSGPHETHPTGGGRVTRQVTNAGDDPDQVLDQDSQVQNGDGKRPLVEYETTPIDTTNKSEDVNPEAKRRVPDMLVHVQTLSVRKNHVSSRPSSFLTRHLPHLHD